MTDTELSAGIETPDQTENAAARAFMRTMTEQLAALLVLALKRNPEIIRAAFVEAMNCDGLTATISKCEAMATALWSRFDAQRDGITELETAAARLENRVSAAEHQKEKPAGPVRLYESEPDEIPFGNTETPWDQLA